MTDSADWLALIDAQFRNLRARLDQNIDVAPAHRSQLEGFIAAAHADGVALDELQRFCVGIAPPNCLIHINAEGTALQLDCWQQRAPVYPSTSS